MRSEIPWGIDKSLLVISKFAVGGESRGPANEQRRLADVFTICALFLIHFVIGFNLVLLLPRRYVSILNSQVAFEFRLPPPPSPTPFSRFVSGGYLAEIEIIIRLLCLPGASRHCSYFAFLSFLHPLVFPHRQARRTSTCSTPYSILLEFVSPLD